MDLTKLGRTERVLAIVGLLAFIDSFLPWWSIGDLNTSAWHLGFWSVLPMLALVEIGLAVALPLTGQSVSIRGGYATFGAAALAASIITLIRLLTYPSADVLGVSAGADFGTYLGLILGIVATVFAYLGFTAAGGTLNNIGAAFSSQPQHAGYVPPAQGYVPPAPGYAPPPEQQAPGTWQQPPQQ